MKYAQPAGSYRFDYPVHMVWLATDACNARCLHCSSSSDRRRRDELSTGEALAVLDEISSGGVVDIGISGGEPLLRADLLDIVDHITARGVSVGIASNGTTLTTQKARRLGELHLHRFQVSLDGFAAAHDTLRCWPGLFKRASRTIRLAIDHGLRTHVCCTINRLNHTTLEPFVDYVLGLGVQRITFSRFVPTGRGTTALDLSATEWPTAAKTCLALRERFRGHIEIVTHLAQQILIDPDVCDMPGFIGCQAGIGQGCITANGTVLPCVLLPIPVGNVRERRFGEIWRNSPVLRSLRCRSTLKGQCGVCSFREQCGGCRAVAFATTGDYLAADSRCWLPRMTDSTHPGERREDDTAERTVATHPLSALQSGGCDGCRTRI